jgi:hypothetical protein
MINDIYAINNKREATATKYSPAQFCLFTEYQKHNEKKLAVYDKYVSHDNALQNFPNKNTFICSRITYAYQILFSVVLFKICNVS